MQQKTLRCRQYCLDITKKTHVMGVINITPDSFFDGGQYFSVNNACLRAMNMQDEGADIIDIGGESTRPGSFGVSVEEELRRVIPVVKRLNKRLKVPISVDTTKFEVAKAALEQGASIINDVSGLRSDERIASLCARYNAGLVIMHMKGAPRTMQKSPAYKNLLLEIRRYLSEGIKIACRNGLKKECLAVDPGIGFGKTLKHNLKLIKELSFFKRLGFPVLIGLSRKSFIGKALGFDVKNRLIPTVAANAIAIFNGANIIRVHDVKEAVAAGRMVDAIRKIV
ncbi:MAG: dihydropteroate synthase [Candidatus Omnitrophota bacterium]